MKVKHIFLFLPFLVSLTAWAAENKEEIPYDDIYLKDGSRYHGYVAEQTPKGEITIHYVWSVHTYLSSEINKKVVQKDSTINIVVGERQFRNVSILTEGDMVTFKREAEGDFTLKKSEIAKTVRPVNDAIYDVVETIRKEKYRGHIVEIEPGKSIQMVRDNGTLVYLLQKNLKKKSLERVCSNTSLISQSPFMETYVMKNGEAFTGIIASQRYDNGQIILLTSNGQEESINLKDVSKISKKPMPEYVTVPSNLGKNQLRLNGRTYVTGNPNIREDVTIPWRTTAFPHFAIVQAGTLIIETNASDKGDYILFPLSYHAVLESPDYVKIATLKKNQLVDITKEQPVSTTISELNDSICTTKYNNVKAGIYAFLNQEAHKVLIVFVLDEIAN